MPDHITGAVGLIGAGRMGGAIGHRLRDLGHPLVVWNRTAVHAQPLVDRGAQAALSCQAVIGCCAVTLCIVQDSAAIQDVYFGPTGILAATLSGRTVVEMTTAEIGAIQQAGAAVLAAGGNFVDAPVSGSVGPARRGELLVLAGGTPDAVAAAEPVLRCLARQVVPVGPVGSGIAMKLALNLPLATYWQALGEALAIGRRHGLEREAMLSLIADSKASVGALPGKLSRILDADLPAEFDIAGLCKDLRCMQDSGAGLQLPASAAALRSAERAVEAGWGGRDVSQLVAYVADEFE